jgi:hypothetical protein
MPKQDGWWKPGKSGNPNGRPTKERQPVELPAFIADCADPVKKQVLTEMWKVIADPKAAATPKLSACEKILDRVIGKAAHEQPGHIDEATGKELVRLAALMCEDGNCPHCGGAIKL